MSVSMFLLPGSGVSPAPCVSGAGVVLLEESESLSNKENVNASVSASVSADSLVVAPSKTLSSVSAPSSLPASASLHAALAYAHAFASASSTTLALASTVATQPKALVSWNRLLSVEEDRFNHALQREEQGELQQTEWARALGKLYQTATQSISRSAHANDEAYVAIWIGCARHLEKRSAEDAVDIFKYMKSQKIGGASAALYAAWARTEHAAGRTDKALGVLSKAIAKGAAPAESLHELEREFAGGKITNATVNAETSQETPARIHARKFTPVVRTTPSGSTVTATGMCFTRHPQLHPEDRNGTRTVLPVLV